MKQFGKFFDFLRDNKCYDNTRIIIVSDHGWRGGEYNPVFDGFENPKKHEAIWFNPMLLVKDFDSCGEVKIDNSFMTSADTLYLAKEGLGLSDLNPFTGKKLKMQKKDGVNIYWCKQWNAEKFEDNETQLPLNKESANCGWHVSDDIFEEKNWVPLLEWEKSQRSSK